MRLIERASFYREAATRISLLRPLAATTTGATTTANSHTTTLPTPKTTAIAPLRTDFHPSAPTASTPPTTSLLPVLPTTSTQTSLGGGLQSSACLVRLRTLLLVMSTLVSTLYSIRLPFYALLMDAFSIICIK